MGFLHVVLICAAPLVSFMVTMGIAFLGERYSTGKDLTQSRLAWTVIAALTFVLTYVCLFKTPLGSPIFELLADGDAGGSLVIFSGSFGVPLPLALFTILWILIVCHQRKNLLWG